MMGVRSLALVGVLLLSGCGSGDELADLRTFLAEARTRPQGRIEPLPEFPPYEAFAYQAGNLRSPFQASVQAPAQKRKSNQSQVRPDTQRPREHLEQFHLEALKLVGTLKMKADGVRWALIETTEGDVHPVRRGHHIGRDYGRITRVADKRIELIEIVANSQGGWVERSRTLELEE